MPAASSISYGFIIMQRIYIVHGYAASVQDHWFNWLKTQMEAKGATVSVLPLPNSANPVPQEWIQAMNEQVAAPDQNTYFVGHSLGCITVLRYLDQARLNKPIGGMVLVAGFAETLPLLPQIAPFTAPGFDAEKIIRQVQQRAVVASDNDASVPFEITLRLSELIDARLHVVENGGHFLMGEGFTTLPVVEQELNRMFAQNAGSQALTAA